VTRRRFIFDPPERFVAGTIGEPGERTFFLQAREGSRVVSVVLEKTQVAVLAERLGSLLFELDRRGIIESPEDDGATDASPLDEPLQEAFRAGTLTLGWDGSTERVLIEARAMTDEDEEPDEESELELDADDESEDGPDLFRVRISADAARAFVDRALRVVQAGRPPCPLCGAPLDRAGHICPRKNGHYVH
jgi:uncharacterized repeat protein (TIGR03847 family)